MPDALTQGFALVRNTQINKRRQELEEARQSSLNKGLDAMFNSRLSDLKREADVQSRTPSLSDDTARYKLEAMQNIKDPEARRGFMQLQMSQQYLKQQHFANQAEISNYKAMIQMQQMALNRNKDVNKQVNDFIDPIFNAIPTGTGAVLRNQIGTTYKKLLSSNDPSIRAGLYDDLKDLNKEVVKLSENYRKEQQKGKSEVRKIGVVGKFTQEDMAKMPIDVRTRLSNAEMSGEPIELRAMKLGRFPGGKPGLIPFGSRDQILDYTGARKMGFSDADWAKAAAIKAPTTAKESVDAQTKNIKKGTSTIRVRNISTGDTGSISEEEYSRRRDEFEVIR